MAKHIRASLSQVLALTVAFAAIVPAADIRGQSPFQVEVTPLFGLTEHGSTLIRNVSATGVGDRVVSLVNGRELGITLGVTVPSVPLQLRAGAFVQGGGLSMHPASAMDWARDPMSRESVGSGDIRTLSLDLVASPFQYAVSPYGLVGLGHRTISYEGLRTDLGPVLPNDDRQSLFRYGVGVAAELAQWGLLKVEMVRQSGLGEGLTVPSRSETSLTLGVGFRIP